MTGNEMRINFLQNEYIPYIKTDMLNIKQLTPAGLIKKCEEYGVERIAGTEALRNRLYNRMWKLKSDAYHEIADTIEAMLEN